MLNEFSRTKLILGGAAMDRLKRSHVAVFGLGSAGALAAEALARCGIGTLTLVDDGVILHEDIAVLITAMHSTLGLNKAQAMKDRIAEIVPATVVCAQDSADVVDAFDYIIDAQNELQSKLRLIAKAHEADIRMVCCLDGDSDGFAVGELMKLEGCPAADAIKKELRQLGIRRQKAVYPAKTAGEDFVPMLNAAGLVLAGEVVCDLSKDVDNI